ncbi:hypothetical protein Y032_0044g1067 [Ancylostoma ceylanicum]|uniref:Uncharacterized protein n=1 Tax=Ancylostoma ceylanicum TaxID=53326 RepID=A0A016UD47_9BILA|nr:hypothetical protein Y032_0044g1067 [Ancylostoma ceylanicum]
MKTVVPAGTLPLYALITTNNARKANTEKFPPKNMREGHLTPVSDLSCSRELRNMSFCPSPKAFSFEIALFTGWSKNMETRQAIHISP